MPIVLIITDLAHGRFGHEARLGDALAGRTVLEHTLRRAARIKGIEKLVLVHPAGQDVAAAVIRCVVNTELPIVTFSDPNGLCDRYTPMRLASRKWAMSAWRGGFGGATCYDELLPLDPVVAAMEAHGADAAAIVRADWCFFDPQIVSRQLKVLVDAPEAMKITFSQAPPGLGGICSTRAVLADLAEHHATFGNTLWYNPRMPVVDPIGREVCTPIPNTIRDSFHRFIYDTPRAVALMRAIADELGDELDGADAAAIAEAARNLQSEISNLKSEISNPSLPRFVWLDITARRAAVGPITPQHYAAFDQADMDTDLAIALVRQVAAAGPDSALILGRLGDPLLHADWARIVEAAHEAGVFALGVETDLLCDTAEVDRLLGLPLDVVTVRLNADTSAVYEKLMGVDGFNRVTRNLQRLFEKRNAHATSEAPHTYAGLPWIVPKLVKVRENLKDMESFFERWVRIAGHAVIERFNTGRGLAPDLSPVPMDPPTPLLTPMDRQCAYVLSNGLLTADDEDWFGRNALGDTAAVGLSELWLGGTKIAEVGR